VCLQLSSLNAIPARISRNGVEPPLRCLSSRCLLVASDTADDSAMLQAPFLHVQGYDRTFASTNDNETTALDPAQRAVPAVKAREKLDTTISLDAVPTLGSTGTIPEPSSDSERQTREKTEVTEGFHVIQPRTLCCRKNLGSWCLGAAQ